MLRRTIVTILLFTDDMVILAEGDELKRGLEVLDEWCREWGVKDYALQIWDGGTGCETR